MQECDKHIYDVLFLHTSLCCFHGLSWRSTWVDIFSVPISDMMTLFWRLTNAVYCLFLYISRMWSQNITNVSNVIGVVVHGGFWFRICLFF